MGTGIKKIYTVALFFAVFSLMISGALVPSAFADKGDDKITELQKQCAKVAKKPVKIKPDCELLNLIEDLQANQNRKIEILSAAMQQDDSICGELSEADFVADTTLEQLCDQADVWIANYQALCNNVPLFDETIGIVNTSVGAIFGAINTSLGGVNSAFDGISNFELSFKIGLPVGIPDVNINLGKPFSFISVILIPLIPGNVIGVVDDKLVQVANCNII